MKKTDIPLPNWMRGACRDADPEVFFLDDKATEVPEIAARYCRICEIQPECLEWAMRYENFGVWGNTTEVQRKKLKRSFTRVHCPGCSSIDVLATWDSAEICLACGLSWRI